MDKLRLVLVLLLSARDGPGDPAVSRVVDLFLGDLRANPPGTHAAAKEFGGDFAAMATAAVACVRRMVGMNLTGQGQGQGDSAGGSGVGLAGAVGGVDAGLGQFTGWAERALGQGLNKVKAGMKTFLQGGRFGGVAGVVDVLSDAKRVAEAGAYATIDPTQPKGSTPPATSARDVVVFLMGGGSYAEASMLQGWASKGGTAQSGRRVLYGCTEIVTGEEMAVQIARLGQMTGAA